MMGSGGGVGARIWSGGQGRGGARYWGLGRGGARAGEARPSFTPRASPHYGHQGHIGVHPCEVAWQWGVRDCVQTDCFVTPHALP